MMRILVVGAGAIGGYFGGRLLEAGRDVTFLVRPQRAEALARTGLVVRSRYGDLALASPPTVTAQSLRESFDLILLSCKAYDLDDAMNTFAPAIGPGTAILPLLNGMNHLDRLAARFGSAAVLGGWCFIAATLDPDGSVRHLNENHALWFGARDGSNSAHLEQIQGTLSGARFEATLSHTIVQEMWEKWVFIAAVAGVTCLMRAAVGDIVAAGAVGLAKELLEECGSIATRHGYPPGAASTARSLRMLTTSGSTLTASMLRDIERNARTEADHIVGELLKRGSGGPAALRLLPIVDAHLKAYEARRMRETA